MKRSNFVGICRAMAAAYAVYFSAAPSTASASSFAPIELVTDHDSIALSDPYCPTCYDGPPSKLVVKNTTEATLTLACDQEVGEPLDGTLVVEVELESGKTVRIHREPRFELCGEDLDAEHEVELHAGPDWGWDEVIEARIAVLEG